MKQNENQLNLTIVALIALVAIVSLVALVLNAKGQAATGAEFAAADGNLAGEGFMSNRVAHGSGSDGGNTCEWQCVVWNNGQCVSMRCL